MSLWLAIPGFIILIAGLLIVPVLMLNDLAKYLRHWRDEHD